MQLNVMRYRRKWHICHIIKNTWLPTDKRFDSIDAVSYFAKVKGYDRVIVRQNQGKKDIAQEMGNREGSKERRGSRDARSSV